MNKLEGHILGVEVSGNLSKVKVELPGKVEISTIVIETPKTASYLEKSRPVHVLFKETEVILAKDVKAEVSLENRIPGKIKSLKSGQIWSEVVLQSEAGTIKALVSTESVDHLKLKEKQSVIAMVKMNEIMLME